MPLRIPDKPRTVLGRGAARAMAIAIAIAVMVAAYQSLTATHGSLATLNSACISDAGSGWEQIDGLVTASAHSGNVAIVCRNIGSPPWLENILASLCFRGSYIALPRRLYVAPRGTIVNEAKDFANLAWEPSPEFCKANGIDALIIVSQDQTGAPTIAAKALEQPAEDRRP